jgi:hypothetical protein
MDSHLWQLDFTRLLDLRVVLVVRECFSNELKTAIRDLPRDARILLRPTGTVEVVVRGLPANCDRTFSPLLEGIVGGMARAP